MFRTMQRYEETEIGLPYPVVMLDLVDEEIDESTGERIGISYPDLDEVVDVVAMGVCQLPFRLLGSEVRFLRSALGMTAKDLAAAMDADPATLSRWENGKGEPGEWADKQVRLSAALVISGRRPHIAFSREELVRLKLAGRPDGIVPSLQIFRNEAREMQLAA